MPQGFRNLEWLNHNENRHYPLTADATLQDISSSFILPEDFIVAMYLPVHWDNNVDPGKFFLYKLVVTEAGYGITIGYSGVSTISVATTLIPKAAHTEGQYYNLSGVGDFFDSRGWIQLGSLDNISEQPAGEFTFDLAGGRLEPDVIRPNLRNVVSLQVQNGTELSSAITGFLRLRGGRNTRFTVLQPSGEDPVIVWDAISDVGLKEDCPCSDELPPPLRTINGVPGDPSRNLTLLSNQCLEISQTGDHALLIKNTCSDPCCGCKELKPIVEALELLGSKHTTFENFIVNLEARVSQMDSIVLGSRLGDRGCSPAAECT